MNVFVSYRHLDQDFALRLVAALRGWGHSPWIDCEHVSPGTDWVETINQGLQLAGVVVGVLSDKSIESKMVLREWLYPLENKIPLILVRLRPCTTPYPYNGLQYIDCSTNEAAGFALLEKGLQSPKPEDFERLLAARPAPAKTIESARQRVTNRAAMLNKVYDFWIKGVLEPAKIGDVWLDLPAEQRPQAVQPEVKRDLHNPDFDSFSLGSDAKIVDVFRRMGNELLILGAPGSGKTITLLELARDLIAQARQDDRQPIPVVFNLSSWAEKHPEKLEDWLIERLFLDYSVSRKLGRSWIENGILLFLFDGLDEVSETYRDACVTAINIFWQNYDQVDNGITVCSRIADYVKLASTLRLENAILLDALSPSQADGYLSKLGKDWDGLRAAIPDDTVLRTFVESPLLLNIMAVAYKDIPSEQLIGLSESEQKQQLFNRYVARRLREDKVPVKYSNLKVRSYLNWLAGKMVDHEQIVFSIEGLQPDWLDCARQRRQYRFVSLLIYWLGGGLLFGLRRDQITENREELNWLWSKVRDVLGDGHVGRLYLGLILFLLGGLVIDQIEIREKLNWSWSIWRRRLVFGSVMGLGIGLLSGLITGLSSELGSGSGLLMGLICGLPFGLVSGLVFGLVSGLGRRAVEQRMRPNEGIWRSLGTGLGVGLVFGLVVGLVGELVLVSFYGPITGLVIGLIFGLQYGGSTVIRHGTLRLMFYRAGVAPLNYAEFLDFCVSRQLMRRVGGGYIFRHRMLMEYFAEREG